MTRQECQQRLMALMDEAYAIAQQYEPTINHLSMYRIKNFTHIHAGRGQHIDSEYSLDDKLVASQFDDDKEASA